MQYSFANKQSTSAGELRTSTDTRTENNDRQHYNQNENKEKLLCGQVYNRINIVERRKVAIQGCNAPIECILANMHSGMVSDASSGSSMDAKTGRAEISAGHRNRASMPLSDDTIKTL